MADASPARDANVDAGAASFGDDYAAAYCDGLARCGFALGDAYDLYAVDGAACVAWWRAHHAWSPDGLVFDPVAAAHCLADLRSHCPLLPFEQPAESCRRAVQDPRAPRIGATCDPTSSDRRCVADAECPWPLAPGARATCVARPRVGADCRSPGPECVPGPGFERAACGATATGVACANERVALASAHSACSDLGVGRYFNVAPDGTVTVMPCDGTTGIECSYGVGYLTCTPLVAEGGACDAVSARCRVGLRCVSGACARVEWQTTAGAACEGATAAECDPRAGLVCNRETLLCVPTGDGTRGAPCHGAANAPCAAGLVCASTHDACAPPGSRGAPCWVGADCASFYCDRGSLTCG